MTLVPLALIACVLTPVGQTSQPGGELLPGFEAGPRFGEQVRSYAFEPDVLVHINAPGVDSFRADRPVRVVIFALPNGNTTAQTIGRRMEPGLDWHFDIQHIGAQIRRLREVMTDANIVVVYLEAKGRSWPRWRQTHADGGAVLVRLIDSLHEAFRGRKVTVALTGHSGGGSLIFGYVNQVERIPDWIDRIVFLDANYGYDDELGHGEKLLTWLRADPEHHLGVIAYDDRRVRIDGKLVVGPTGGTFRKTQRMVERLGRDVELKHTQTDRYERFTGLGGRIELTLVNNPDDAILHTVLVEKNGLIHGLTFDTPWEARAGEFMADRAYDRWIQPF
jgi:hypothetical protein